MSNIPRFAAYAAAFEKAFESDDWSEVKDFFAEDAVYEINLAPPIGGRFEGRDSIATYFKDILDRFDRRFASRKVDLLEGPTEEGDSVWIRGAATYQADGVPELRFELEEIVTFEGDRIRHLQDRYSPSEREAMEAYLKGHAAKLGISLGG